MFDLQYFIEFYQALVYQSFMHKIYGTYCAALTPINSDRSINKELFLNHCKHLLAEGVDGLAVFGTTGEANSFSMSEKIEAINYLIDNNVKAEKLIPGIGQCSIKDTIALSQMAAKLIQMQHYYIKINLKAFITQQIMLMDIQNPFIQDF